MTSYILRFVKKRKNNTEIVSEPKMVRVAQVPSQKRLVYVPEAGRCPGGSNLPLGWDGAVWAVPVASGHLLAPIARRLMPQVAAVGNRHTTNGSEVRLRRLAALNGPRTTAGA